MNKLLITVLGIATLLPAIGSARVFYMVRPAIGIGYGPYWNYNPYYGAYPIVRHSTTSSIKFDTSDKAANVLVNNAYVGTVADVKTLHLKPGTYDINLTEQGHASYHEKVYVAPDHTLKLHPVLPLLTN
jgi:hypothetical protein